MSRFEKPDDFVNAYPHAAPAALTIRTLALLAALLVYGAGFVLLYPIVSSRVAESALEGNDPALLQFVAP